MVLRIKEREEANQLITMDPKVCGKLLTLHRRGNGVNVQALRDQIPLQQDAGKGPQMGSHGVQKDAAVEKWFCGSPRCFQGIRVYIQAEELGQGSYEGPTRVGACPPASWPPHCVSDFISKSSGLLSVQERSSRRFHSVWSPFGIPFLQNSKIGTQKTETVTRPLVNRLVPKII